MLGVLVWLFDWKFTFWFNKFALLPIFSLSYKTSQLQNIIQETFYLLPDFELYDF